jgi:CRP-like cAMP-binding protein
MADAAPSTKRLPLEGIADEVNGALYASGHVAFYPDATPILNLGQEQDHLFFLESGVIEVDNIHGGRIFDVGQIQPGSFFGEIGFFTDHTSTVTLQAKTSCSVWSISKEEFTKFLDANPASARPVLYFFLRVVSNRLRTVYEQSDDKDESK